MPENIDESKWRCPSSRRAAALFISMFLAGCLWFSFNSSFSALILLFSTLLLIFFLTNVTFSNQVERKVKFFHVSTTTCVICCQVFVICEHKWRQSLRLVKAVVMMCVCVDARPSEGILQHRVCLCFHILGVCSFILLVFRVKA